MAEVGDRQMAEVVQDHRAPEHRRERGERVDQRDPLGLRPGYVLDALPYPDKDRDVIGYPDPKIVGSAKQILDEGEDGFQGGYRSAY